MKAGWVRILLLFVINVLSNGLLIKPGPESVTFTKECLCLSVFPFISPGFITIQKLLGWWSVILNISYQVDLD